MNTSASPRATSLRSKPGIVGSRFPALALAGLLAGAALPESAAWAQSPSAPPGYSVGTAAGDVVDPPGRVGRLSELVGQVWLYHPGGGEWMAAERNRPLTTGDRLATDAGARAEVRVGSTTLRLDGGSELEVLRLDDERIDLKLHNGSLAARLRSREAVPEFAVETGEGRFSVQRTGRYRIDRADETSHITVSSGQALYEGPGSALTVNSGQRAEFWLDRASAAQYSITEPQRDAFANWTAERDRADDRSASARYVSPEMTGVEDLDRHGRWEETAEYGAVWYPRVVASGWAPYSAGRWAWVQPWGWTWVDDAPWGFAPFHYGRWVYLRNSWCWAPGNYVRRPVYAPALVAWIGGPRLSLSLNIGGGPSVGWLPLAPREVYVPHYRVTPRYVREVNVTHVTNITNITTIVNNPQAAVQRDFSNRKFPHAVTVVPSSVLSGRQAVAPEAARWRDAPEVREFSRQPPRMSAVLTPAVTPPPQMPPSAARGEPLPPPGRARALVPRGEEAIVRRSDPGSRVAAPMEPGRPSPAPSVEPPSRARVYPSPNMAEGSRQSDMPARVQAPQVPPPARITQPAPVQMAPPAPQGLPAPPQAVHPRMQPQPQPRPQAPRVQTPPPQIQTPPPQVQQRPVQAPTPVAPRQERGRDNEQGTKRDDRPSRERGNAN